MTAPGTVLFVDTNVFIRFLTDEPRAMAEECTQFLRLAEAGEFDLVTSHMTVAEVVWTLGSLYRRPRAEIAAALRQLLDLRSLRIDDKNMLREAVDLYAATNVDFIDAYHAADARRRRIQRICSYDHDFDSLPVERVEPGALIG